MTDEQRNLVEDLRSAYHIARTLYKSLKICEEQYIGISGHNSPEIDDTLAEISRSRSAFIDAYINLRNAINHLCEEDINEATRMLRYTLLGENFNETVVGKISSEE